ncbi:CubicO group peptidase (beta-lactamase class C family) [Motilibacter peucedani]|uniref:CubicO group peptidase (Beta-lactamase class C family) n=1 Tax=Motilibacter peucedani TaxID=598650 RepID=A0A420XUA8_9ACTN|nr:serine hydrolase [Motilibacter peucedani]RKS80433.1 CubicO group peptidase (beta-lactamase class C family) [Motilibacter peucedani]
MSPSPLPRSRSSEQGVNAAGVLAFVDALEASDNSPHSMMLLRHGTVVAEGWWAPYSADRLHLLYSLSKSFTSSALGIAVGEGLADLDDTVLQHFPELDAEVTDSRSRAIKIRHVAAMASGHTGERREAALDRDPDNMVRGFLLTPPEEEPGSVFAYNQPCTYSLGAIVMRESGEGLTDYLRTRLLDPLGIGEVAWLRDRSGAELGYSGLHATTDAIARLGQLYLQDGVWEGERLLPEGWVAQATRSQVSNEGFEDHPDWQAGYGFQFWVARHGYRADGAYGQLAIVLPEQGAVLALTTEGSDIHGLMDLAWEHLLPAFEGAGTPEADDALAARMASLTVPPVTGSAEPAEEGWDGFHADGEAGSPLASVALTRDQDGWELLLVSPEEPVTELRVPLGTNGWAVSEPLAAHGKSVPLATSGAWREDGALAVDVAFLETPHTLQLVCDAAAGTVTADWRTEPLHRRGRLSWMRAPRD